MAIALSSLGHLRLLQFSRLSSSRYCSAPPSHPELCPQNALDSSRRAVSGDIIHVHNFFNPTVLDTLLVGKRISHQACQCTRMSSMHLGTRISNYGMTFSRGHFCLDVTSYRINHLRPASKCELGAINYCASCSHGTEGLVLLY